MGIAFWEGMRREKDKCWVFLFSKCHRLKHPVIELYSFKNRFFCSTLVINLTSNINNKLLMKFLCFFQCYTSPARERERIFAG